MRRSAYHRRGWVGPTCASVVAVLGSVANDVAPVAISLWMYVLQAPVLISRCLIAGFGVYEPSPRRCVGLPIDMISYCLNPDVVGLGCNSKLPSYSSSKKLNESMFARLTASVLSTSGTVGGGVGLE